MSNHINVKATRWEGGWELEIDENHHTQTRHLKDARQQVINYLDTTWDTVDHTNWRITITPAPDITDEDLATWFENADPQDFHTTLTGDAARTPVDARIERRKKENLADI